jgi:hypothetical protein
MDDECVQCGLLLEGAVCPLCKDDLSEEALDNLFGFDGEEIGSVIDTAYEVGQDVIDQCGFNYRP